MANPRWHERLRQALAKQGLPAAYSACLLEELAGHWEDLQKEHGSMDALSAEERLGAPELLAVAAREEYRKRSFAGRHPFLAFVVGPFLTTIVTWHALVLMCVPLKSLVTPYMPVVEAPPTRFEWALVYVIVLLLRFVPFAVLAPLFVRMGRASCRPVWGMVACGIVAYMAFLNELGVASPTESHNLAVFFSWQFGLVHWYSRLLQAGIPVVLSIWAWRRWGNSAGASSPSLPISAVTSL